MQTAVLTVYLLFFSVSLILKCLNLRHLKDRGGEVPPEFAGAVNAQILQQTAAYTVETSRLAMVASIVDSGLVLLFFFGGLIVVYDGWIFSLCESFVGRGVLFFLGIYYLETLFGIPFNLFKNFNIENRYGFNTMTPRLWLSDLVKSIVISTVLLAALVAAGLYLVDLSPQWWWLWVWGVFLFVSIFLMYISPYLIEPLFFRFEPLQIEELESDIRALVEKTGLKVNHVLQVDASRRSRHSNAYFSGIGRVKRIVLFDTLLESMSHREILAVLAHELGHWKKRHILKRIILTEAAALGASFLAFKMLAWEGLPQVVGLQQGSFYVRVAVLGFLGSLLVFPLAPVVSFISRSHEWEADRFACELTGRPLDLAGALVKLSRENLANLHPHPLYAAFYYSHPPVVERVRALKQQAGAQEEMVV
ncbi:MAG: M48 family metallopeptidase [Syntrophobacteria bacterium]